MTRILLVEDNPGDAVIFRETLDASALEYALVHAKRLGEGLERLGNTDFDILMVDLSLPDAHGMEAVRKVRKAAPDLPLIVLTGLDDAAAAAEAKSLGAVDYLVKWYVDSASLARYIRYAIAQYEMYGDGSNPPKAATQSASSEEMIVEGRVVRPLDGRQPSDESSGDGLSDEQTDLAPSARRAEPDVPKPQAVLQESEISSDLLRQATEAVLAFAEQSERRSAWMADVLRSALDLHRVSAGEVAVRSNVIDVLDLARQMATEQRSLAMRCGVPLHVTSDRKKVMAQADRNLVIGTLRRLVVDALQSANAEGVKMEVDMDGPSVVIETVWTGSRTSIDAAEDCITLGRSVVEQTVRHTNGEAIYQSDASGRYVLTLRLPGPE